MSGRKLARGIAGIGAVIGGLGMAYGITRGRVRRGNGSDAKTGRKRRCAEQTVPRKSIRVAEEAANKLFAFGTKQWTKELAGKWFTDQDGLRKAIAKVRYQRTSSEWVVDAGDAPCPLYTVLELAEDEEWYKEAYGVFNKKKFGSGEAPGEGDRVTKFFYDGEAYDGTVAEVTVEDVRRRPGEKARRMKLWDVAFDDGDRAGLSEIEAVAARRAFSRRNGASAR